MFAQSEDPMLPTLCRVCRRQAESGDTFTLELEAVNGDGDTSFMAGQFNMLYVYGVGEVPISISGSPDQADRLVHTTRAVGTVTRAMDRLQAGDMIGVRGPFGSRWPTDRAEAKDVLIIAGGIGLAPLRPALYEMLGQRDRYGRIILLYGARTQEEMLYRSELEQWRSRFDLEVYVTVDRATDQWYGNVGVVTALIPRAPFDPRNTIAMICGPEIMMRFTVQALREREIPNQRIFLSLERNMKCATGFCGHCQYGPTFICKDGPIFRYDRIERFFGKWEV